MSKRASIQDWKPIFVNAIIPSEFEAWLGRQSDQRALEVLDQIIDATPLDGVPQALWNAKEGLTTKVDTPKAASDDR